MQSLLTQTIGSVISKGLAERVTGIKESSSTVSIADAFDLKSILLSSDSTPAKTPPAVVAAKVPGANSKDGGSIDHKPNALTAFASYTPLWTLSALTPAQLNDPTLYRDKPSSSTAIVLSSAGRFDGQRTQTLFGAPEYFINDIDITSLIGPNPKTQNASAHTFKFKVFEPYSMGLFLQSLQSAARTAGHPSYLNGCPYLLRMDIQGWDINGNAVTAPKLSRYFPIRLVNATFECNEAGSTYQIDATPFNSSAFGDVINKVYKDVNIV
jgi:hypothetical protein